MRVGENWLEYNDAVVTIIPNIDGYLNQVQVQREIYFAVYKRTVSQGSTHTAWHSILPCGVHRRTCRQMLAWLLSWRYFQNSQVWLPVASGVVCGSWLRPTRTPAAPEAGLGSL